MAGPARRRIPPLTEDAAAAPPQQRLSSFGQVLLAAAILLSGLAIYASAWEIGHRLNSRGEACLKLPAASPIPPVAAEQNRLLRQSRLGLQLIEQLPAATPGQRLRLGEQLNDLVRELDSLCRLSNHLGDEAGALLTVATTCASVLVICLVMVAPQGVQSINRTMRTVIFSTGAMLGLTVNFLQLGEPQVNNIQVRRVYHSDDALLQRLTSSLANRQIEPGLLAEGRDPQPLDTPAAVAQLISTIDTQQLAMPDPRLQLSGNMAQTTWSRLLTGDRDAADTDAWTAPAEQQRPGRNPTPPRSSSR